jgi:hypothetical protein
MAPVKVVGAERGDYAAAADLPDSWQPERDRPHSAKLREAKDDVPADDAREFEEGSIEIGIRDVLKDLAAQRSIKGVFCEGEISNVCDDVWFEVPIDIKGCDVQSATSEDRNDDPIARADDEAFVCMYPDKFVYLVPVTRPAMNVRVDSPIIFSRIEVRGRRAKLRDGAYLTNLSG